MYGSELLQACSEEIKFWPLKGSEGMLPPPPPPQKKRNENEVCQSGGILAFPGMLDQDINYT